MTNLATKIQWSQATWSPVTGCTRVSAGCDRCYITSTPPFRIAHRTFDRPGIGGTTGVLLHPDRITAPLHWRKPRRVFVNSLSDLFHDDVPDTFIADVFAVMALTPQHTYQLLTKRPTRMRSLLKNIGFWYQVGRNARHVGYEHDGAANYFPDGRNIYDTAVWERLRYLDNVWLGVSIEDQATAALRIPVLLETPAAIRWISAEPLIGPIDLRNLQARNRRMDALGGDVGDPEGREVWTCTPSVLDWIVIGGESGPGARPMDLDWAQAIVDEARPLYDTRVFVKQLGTAWAKANGAADRKGGNPDEWPAGLKIRQYPRQETRS